MQSAKSKVCKECGSTELVPNRRYCKVCLLARKRAQAKKRYGGYGRYMYKNTCQACGDAFKAWRKAQKLCKSCYKIMVNTGFEANPYENGGGDGYCWKHRRVSETVLGRKLKSHEVVHHVDGNTKNNDKTNLMVLTRRMHGKLHLHLRLQRVIMEKSINENSEDCWNTLIAPMTTAWLETTSAKVIKLWEIGQSAAEPLKD